MYVMIDIFTHEFLYHETSYRFLILIQSMVFTTATSPLIKTLIMIPHNAFVKYSGMRYPMFNIII